MHSSTLAKSVVVGIADHSCSFGRKELGVVVCDKRSAHVKPTDPHSLKNVEKHYVVNQVVDDLTVVDNDVPKVEFFDAWDAKKLALPLVQDFADSHDVVVSGESQADVVVKGTNKDAALCTL